MGCLTNPAAGPADRLAPTDGPFSGAWAVDRSAPRLPSQPTGRSSPPAWLRPPTVLVVDDEPDQLDLLCTCFQRAGCEVYGVDAAAPALRRAAETPIHLAVVDLRLPDVSGWALAAMLRRDHQECRVTICSVLDPQDYPPSDDILPKPFTQAQVTALVARHARPASR